MRTPDLVQAWNIVCNARKDLGQDLGGFAMTDLLLDNMPHLSRVEARELVAAIDKPEVVLTESERVIATCNTFAFGQLSGDGIVWTFDAKNAMHQVSRIDRNDNITEVLHICVADPQAARLAFIAAVARGAA